MYVCVRVCEPVCVRVRERVRERERARGNEYTDDRYCNVLYIQTSVFTNVSLVDGIIT